MLFVSDTQGHRVGIYVGRFSRARLNGQLCSWTWQKPRTQRSSHGRAAFSKGQSLTAIRTPTGADTSEPAVWARATGASSLAAIRAGIRHASFRRV